MDEQNKIVDQSDDRKYFTLTPRIVWALSRSPYDYTLWCVIKDIAGEQGECYLSTPDLARMAMMSTGKAHDCRKYLIENKLLCGEKIKDPNYPLPVWHLSIPNLWLENIKWCELHKKIADRLAFKGKHLSCGENGDDLSLHEKTTTPDEKTLSPGETKKNQEVEPKEGLFAEFQEQNSADVVPTQPPEAMEEPATGQILDALQRENAGTWIGGHNTEYPTEQKVFDLKPLEKRTVVLVNALVGKEASVNLDRGEMVTNYTETSIKATRLDNNSGDTRTGATRTGKVDVRLATKEDGFIALNRILSAGKTEEELHKELQKLALTTKDVFIRCPHCDMSFPPVISGASVDPSKVKLPASITSSATKKEQKKPQYLPATSAAKYLAGQEIGRWKHHWLGFTSKDERDDWVQMETLYEFETIKSKIDYFVKQGVGLKHIAQNVITAMKNHVQPNKKSEPVYHDNRQTDIAIDIPKPKFGKR